MQLVIITGLSGSGKSVALKALEDGAYYTTDNLPARLLPAMVDFLREAGYLRVAVSIDARSGDTLNQLPLQVNELKSRGVDVRVLFLDAKSETLLKRFSETRRRHPLSAGELTVAECIARERELLAEIGGLSHHIDTSDLNPNALRGWIKEFVESAHSGMTLLFQSFGYKHGIPLDADLVFDVRCLPNPYYDPQLRPLTGKDRAVVEFLEADANVRRMYHDIRTFVENWLPCFLRRQPQLRDGRHRLHRRRASFGVFRRNPCRSLPAGAARDRAPPRAVVMTTVANHGGTAPARTCIFPLNTVLFPGGVLPLKIFEQRYIEMTKVCIKEDRPFGVCLIKEGREVGTPAVPQDVGCLARIAHWDMPQLGVFHLQVEGLQRFRILRSEVDKTGLISAAIEPLEIDAEVAPAKHAVQRSAQSHHRENRRRAFPVAAPVRRCRVDRLSIERGASHQPRRETAAPAHDRPAGAPCRSWTGSCLRRVWDPGTGKHAPRMARFSPF